MTFPPLQILLLLLSAAAAAAAQPLSPPGGSSLQVTFRPSIAVVIGIFSIMFSLTFLLLMYGKFCRSGSPGFFAATGTIISGDGGRAEGPRTSGIEKSVIDALPFFKFSAIRGSRDGLECSVCLSRFEGEEVLRLLPRCKHAFHKGCIDQWLESHSSCPLCRARVDVDDIAFFKYSASSRRVETVDGCGESGLDLYVEREPGSCGGGPTSVREKKAAAAAGDLHSFKHRILVSGVVFNSRWSDFNSADLISLDSEMLRALSSRRFEGAGGSEGAERKRGLEMRMPAEEESSSGFVGGEMRALISPASRCMSDISGARGYRDSGGGGEREERLRKKWLPIARRTVRWFAGKEGRAVVRRDEEHV